MLRLSHLIRGSGYTVIRGEMTNSRRQAPKIAAALLSATLPRRWSHVQGVAGRARELYGDGLLVSAAWLHDIGYAPGIASTGFHPIDGARWLRARRWDEELVSLVAHHSCARVEAELRGLGSVLLEEFPRNPALPHDELCFCDLTTSPDGELVTPQERLAEIRRRYPSGHVVRAFVDRAETDLLAAVRRVEGASRARGGAQPR